MTLLQREHVAYALFADEWARIEQRRHHGDVATELREAGARHRATAEDLVGAPSPLYVFTPAHVRANGRHALRVRARSLAHNRIPL